MFRLAILGPILRGGFGLARQCEQCHLAGDGQGDPSCRGFGAGCLGYRRAKPVTDASDYQVRFGTLKTPVR